MWHNQQLVGKQPWYHLLLRKSNSPNRTLYGSFSSDRPTNFSSSLSTIASTQLSLTYNLVTRRILALAVLQQKHFDPKNKIRKENELTLLSRPHSLWKGNASYTKGESLNQSTFQVNIEVLIQESNLVWEKNKQFSFIHLDLLTKKN